ncbi:similar to Saccharomyces cerevisiae YDR049W VMS1 Component of a Cdc48p-complex involved in protein quality control [Maudiozyma saulgeensis]|uniref:Similar to Saccharomyces cerevisiae YDR049W VMS1 Component of a Cdc48p-complex involved in protein quality control n=1 Tax=Maudiozyma saulgeensis TaxID=1789683 RepID=A0A1X7R3X3_9SACH|nr:similar to Saccharomyces cerevisiae YDR049W VMS1 Component of a Cdc48p-complex involved in protein quality control [Kazachstania saulgeensis]
MSFKKHDTYVYQLSQPVLDSLELLYFDDKLNVCQPSSPTELPITTSPSFSKVSETIKNGASTTNLHCNTCNVDLVDITQQRAHYQNELHTVNLKRKFHGLSPVSDLQKLNEESKKTKESNTTTTNHDENDNQTATILEENENSTGSEDESDEDNESDEDDIYKENSPSLDSQFNSLTPFEENEKTESHLMNQTPYVLFQSKMIEKKRSVFGAYKVLFNNDQLQNPRETLNQWSQNIESTSNKFSAIFMIGGGHFAGAIISHQRLNISGNLRKQNISQQEQATLFLEHKTFHRYTTRRKQGGSQSAMDNAKGKANSAGSTIRRYNEAALKIDVQTLLKDWKPYLDDCENIFIRARSASDRRIFFEEDFLQKNDIRIRNLPFTTGRPTVGELKRSWCELSYLKITDLPNPIVVKENTTAKESKKKSRSSSLEVSLTTEEKQTDEIVQLLKKGRAPLLISYLRKNKIDKDFLLVPKTKYATTPTMLHYCSQNGLKQMILILLTNLKCSPTIQNNNGRTAWDLTKSEIVKQSFQIARHNMGENFTSWEDAHVDKPLSREEVELINKKLEDEEKSEVDNIVKRELQNVKERQKEDYEKKNGKGHALNAPTSIPSISMEQNLNSLTSDQKRRLMREQRARAAEARMQQTK